jgi:transcription elongation factor B subunit 1
MSDTQSNENKYGGCEGPEAMYVKLVSNDQHEFIIKRDYALTSGTIKAMLSGPGMCHPSHFKLFISSSMNLINSQF